MNKEFWFKLGNKFIVDDDVFLSPQCFIFGYNDKEDLYESEVQYNDYNDLNELDRLIDELEDTLIKKEVGYQILITSYAYFIKIDVL